MEYWNDGLRGGKTNKSIPCGFDTTITLFHYSIIPLGWAKSVMISPQWVPHFSSRLCSWTTVFSTRLRKLRLRLD
jgi:hypothetical protein